MSQYVAPSGRTWSGSVGPFPGIPRSTRAERYRELKQLEQTARKSAKEIKTLEAEIRDLSASFERLQERDAEGMQRLGEIAKLVRNDEAAKHDLSLTENIDSQEPKENGHYQLEGSADTQETYGDLEEELKTLEREHEAAQSHLSRTKAVLEQKRAELEVLAGAYKVLIDQIDKEETDLQATELEESLQQSVAVHQEMKHLSEDIGRIGRIMEGLKETGRLVDGSKDINTEQLKQNLRIPLKQRVYHQVTGLRNKNLSRNLQNGSAPDLGRATSVPVITRSKEITRIKEPAEFEEREGSGTRKRQKNSGFESQLEQLHKQREKLEIEAEEKKTLLDSLASLSSQTTETEASRLAASRGMSLSRQIVSPSSVFERFEVSPSLGAVQAGSMRSTSASSDLSSEVSLEKVDKGLVSSAAKRLNFECAKEGGASTTVADLADTASSSNSKECFSRDAFEYKEQIIRGTSLGAKVEIESEGSSSEKGEEVEVPCMNNGTEEIHSSVEECENGRQDGELVTEIEEADEIGRISEEESVAPWKFAAERTSEEVGITRRKEAIEVEEGVTGSWKGVEKTSVEELITAREGVEEIERTSEDTDGGCLGEPTGDTAEEKGERVEKPLGQFEYHTEGDGIEEGFQDIERAHGGFDDLPDIEELVKEEALNPGSGVDEIKMSWGDALSLGYVVDDIEIPWEGALATDNGVDEFEMPSEEAFATGNGVDEIDTPVWEDKNRFEHAEIVTGNTAVSFMTTKSGVDKCHEPLEGLEISECGEGEEGIQAGSLSIKQTYQLQEMHQNGFTSAQKDSNGLQTPPEAGTNNFTEDYEQCVFEQVPLEGRKMMVKGVSNECINWRLEAENQVTQLSSQLSFLQKQVEEEMELHQKTRNNFELENTSADAEHIRKQVNLFADEVGELRQSIEEIQRKLYKDGGDGSLLEHWAKDLHSKCADQSAQLENLGKQVSLLDKELKSHVKVRSDIEDFLDKEEQERLRVNAQLMNLSEALAHRVSTIEKEEEAVGELVEQQKHLLIEQLREAEKFRHIAELRVKTLNKQIEHLERVCDVAQTLGKVSKYQDKVLKYGLQAVVQLFMLVVGVITLYSRIAKPLRGSLVPT